MFMTTAPIRSIQTSRTIGEGLLVVISVSPKIAKITYKSMTFTLMTTS